MLNHFEVTWILVECTKKCPIGRFCNFCCFQHEWEDSVTLKRLEGVLS